jgi:hypothetical protein
MVVGARRTGLCQEQQRCWVFHPQQFLCVSRMVHCPTVGSIGVDMCRHPRKVHAPDESRLFRRQRGRGLQLNIRKVFLMFCTLNVCHHELCCHFFFYKTIVTLCLRSHSLRMFEWQRESERLGTNILQYCAPCAGSYCGSLGLCCHVCCSQTTV